MKDIEENKIAANEKENKVEELKKEESVNEEGNSRPKTKRNSWIFIIVFVIFLCVLGCVCWFLFRDSSTVEKTENDVKKVFSEYKMSGNSLEKFDLSFLKLENESKNKVYSPLSIKYALQMLSEGASGNTKAQLNGVIGEYKSKKYIDSANMSFANALFIRDSFKSSINENYILNLKNKYNADVVYDSFNNATNFNSWVSNKTFNLINNLYTDQQIVDKNYILTNALAIDMEWNKRIQARHLKDDAYGVRYAHEKFGAGISPLTEGYRSEKFNDGAVNAKVVQVGAAINKYDIVKTLGEDNIRKTVGEAYTKWLTTDEESKFCTTQNGYPTDVNKYLDTYISEINSNYKRVDSSTDFSFFTDDDVKVFAKDLKTYNDTTLQYVGIMPKKVALDSYIKDLSIEKVNSILTGLKDIKLENFKEGVITNIKGNIPLFSFDYSLNLLDDLKKLGIVDVFDINKANLSLLSSDTKTYIADASHKANIEFSNEGIKASAATAIGGAGSASGCFNYLYDVPVEEIDLTFNNPYMFLIRDKNSGEVWFAGTVYEPIEWQAPGY